MEQLGGPPPPTTLTRAGAATYTPNARLSTRRGPTSELGWATGWARPWPLRPRLLSALRGAGRRRAGRARTVAARCRVFRVAANALQENMPRGRTQTLARDPLPPAARPRGQGSGISKARLGFPLRGLQVDAGDVFKMGWSLGHSHPFFFFLLSLQR